MISQYFGLMSDGVAVGSLLVPFGNIKLVLLLLLMLLLLLRLQGCRLHLTRLQLKNEEIIIRLQSHDVEKIHRMEPIGSILMGRGGSLFPVKTKTAQLPQKLQK